MPINTTLAESLKHCAKLQKRNDKDTIKVFS